MNVQYCWSFPVSQEDLALGTEIYLSFKFVLAPQRRQQGHFFESFLKDNQSSLATVIAATMHTIHPLAGDNIKDMTDTRGWKRFTTFPWDLKFLACFYLKT